MENQFIHQPSGIPSRRGSKVLRIIGMAFIGVVFAVLFAFVFGLVVKLLWNWLMPAIFGLPLISYWQAFGIVILAKLLFGAFGPHHRNSHNHFSRKIRDKWHIPHNMKGHDSKMFMHWKYYKQYWEEKGKADFDEYVKEKEDQSKE